MHIVKHVGLDLVRRKKKTVLMLFVMVLIFSLVLGVLTLRKSVSIAKDTIIEKIGATVTLDYIDYSKDPEKLFTDEIMNKLAIIDHVKGVNQKYSDFAMPVNFNNSKAYSGANPFQQPVLMEQEDDFGENIVVEGDKRIDLVDLFRKNQATIIDGDFPVEDNPGALISSQLARQNSLQIGDCISVNAYNKNYTTKIVGIYETEATFTITSDNIIGKHIFAHSPFNRIYVDLSTAANIFNVDTETLYFDIHIDDPVNVQSVSKTIQELDLDWNSLSLINTTASIYDNIATNIKALSGIVDLYAVFICIVSSIALILITSIWAETFRYESSIYLSLGASKWRTASHLFLSTSIISIPAQFCAVLLSKPIAGLLLKTNQHDYSSTNIHSQFETGLNIGTEIILINPDINIYAIFLLTVFAVIIIACLLPLYSVLRLKPREILSMK